MSKKCDKLPQVRISKQAHEKLKRLRAQNPYHPKLGTIAELAIAAFNSNEDISRLQINSTEKEAA